MADFRQYTNCVDIKDFDPTNPFVQAALLGLYVTLPPERTGSSDRNP